MKNVLVTGGAGFIGSNFVKFMLVRYYEYKIIKVDALTYAENLENLKDVVDNSNYRLIRADIRDREQMDYICAYYDIDNVVILLANHM